jgi:phosphoglycolate phosphatase-like HAD superfamily hydrolase
MKNITDYNVIIWDFDGVIMDSMSIRGEGFRNVLKNYPKDQVDELMAFHESNGGLSRYVKFRYFFENIRGEQISEQQVLDLASSFSEIMLDLLLNDNLLIMDSVNFIKQNYNKYEMHIASGSDGMELNKICKGLKLDSYFRSINGSPTPKNDLVKQILNSYKEKNNLSFVLIGDSINDFDATKINNIDFLGYNNTDLLKSCTSYIYEFP